MDNNLTILDNKAWGVYQKYKTEHSVLDNIYFFAYHKDSFPYNKYYDEAKILLRKDKIELLKNKIL